MEPTLVIIGVNHRTAPVEVRERFWMSECRQGEALSTLSSAEGIEEVFVFSTCNRTEFVVWGDPTLAENSVLRFLSAEYNLRLCEWRNFYRLLDEQAVAHAFRVSCGLDSMHIGEGQIGRQVNAAWEHARKAGCTGQYLDALLKKALSVRKRVRKAVLAGSNLILAPHAAVELAVDIFVSIARCKVVLLGAGKMNEVSARALAGRGATSVCVVNHSDESALALSKRTGIESCSYEQRSIRLADADLVISATSAPGFILTSSEVKTILAQRKERKLVIMDLALPRDVDPEVREIEGVLLYDLDDLERASLPRAGTREGEAEAERMVLAEAQQFRKEQVAEEVAPELAALRHRLDDICQQELESFRHEQGPFPKDQDQLLAAVSARITHKIAGSLARELKGHPEARTHRRFIASA